MRIPAIFGLLVLLCGCAEASPPGGRLENALTQAADASGDAGVIVYVEGPALSAPFMGSTPAADGAPIDPNATLRIASNTKTFVAVAALRLVEQGRLDLDAPVSATLPFDFQSLLADGGYDVDAITARMLLQHTAGIADHTQLDTFSQAILTEPGRLWSSREQVALAMREGTRVGEPGARFQYSDTGYILLAEIIQNVHGAPLADSVYELSGLAAMGLQATWWEGLQLAPDPAPPVLAQTAFGLSLWDISASYDLFGGGGLISNMPDLAHYHRAAVRGDMFEADDVAEQLLVPSAQSVSQDGPGYAMGLFVRQIEGETCYTHAGFWGTLALYCPESDVAVAAAVTDANGFGALYPFARTALVAAR